MVGRATLGGGGRRSVTFQMLHLRPTNGADLVQKAVTSRTNVFTSAVLIYPHTPFFRFRRWGCRTSDDPAVLLETWRFFAGCGR